MRKTRQKIDRKLQPSAAGRDGIVFVASSTFNRVSSRESPFHGLAYWWNLFARIFFPPPPRHLAEYFDEFVLFTSNEILKLILQLYFSAENQIQIQFQILLKMIWINKYG